MPPRTHLFVDFLQRRFDVVLELLNVVRVRAHALQSFRHTQERDAIGGSAWSSCARGGGRKRAEEEEEEAARATYVCFEQRNVAFVQRCVSAAQQRGTRKRTVWGVRLAKNADRKVRRRRRREEGEASAAQRREKKKKKEKEEKGFERAEKEEEEGAPLMTTLSSSPSTGFLSARARGAIPVRAQTELN